MGYQYRKHEGEIGMTPEEFLYYDETALLSQGDAFQSLRRILDCGIQEVRGIFGARYEVDEIAILFPDIAGLANFAKTAYRERFRLAAIAEDIVSCEPIVSRYRAEYWFFYPPVDNPLFPYPNVRIEAMLCGAGSPLHATTRALAGAVGIPVAIHVSFKCEDEEAYALANGALRQAGWMPAQSCTSDYGRFTYWIGSENRSPSSPYIKPRVNLRDRKD